MPEDEEEVIDKEEDKRIQKSEHIQFADYYRLHSLCALADRYRILVSSFKFKNIRPFYSVLSGIWAVLKPILPDAGKNMTVDRVDALLVKLDVQTKEVALAILEGKDFELPQEFQDDLFLLFDLIMQIRQEANFGFPMKRYRMAKNRVRGAFMND